MYISGNISNFASRLHQLPSGIIDLTGVSNNFWLEGQSYTGAPIGLRAEWSKEYSKKYYEITKTGINSTGYFNGY